LNVSVFCQEFDKAFKTIEAAAYSAEEDPDNSVILTSLSNHFFVEFEDDSDELNESNQEGAHCQ